VIEVTRRVRAELPPTHALSIKLGFIYIVEGGLDFDESIPRARLVCAAGADAIEVSLNLMSSYADNIVPYVAVTTRRAVADLLPHRLLRPADAERVIFAYINLDRVAEAGQRSPLVTPRKDRRRDLYSVTYLGHQL